MANKRIKDLATTKYKGFMALDDADGTGKMDVATIFNNFTGRFTTRTSENPYKTGDVFVKDGTFYEVTRNFYGDFDSNKVRVVTLENLMERYFYHSRVLVWSGSGGSANRDVAEKLSRVILDAKITIRDETDFEDFWEGGYTAPNGTSQIDHHFIGVAIARPSTSGGVTRNTIQFWMMRNLNGTYMGSAYGNCNLFNLSQGVGSRKLWGNVEYYSSSFTWDGVALKAEVIVDWDYYTSFEQNVQYNYFDNALVSISHPGLLQCLEAMVTNAAGPLCIAPSFNSSRTSTNPYKTGEAFSYNGKFYEVTRNFYGDFDATKARETSVYNLMRRLEFKHRPLIWSGAGTEPSEAVKIVSRSILDAKITIRDETDFEDFWEGGYTAPNGTSQIDHHFIGVAIARPTEELRFWMMRDLNGDFMDSAYGNCNLFTILKTDGTTLYENVKYYSGNFTWGGVSLRYEIVVNWDMFEIIDTNFGYNYLDNSLVSIEHPGIIQALHQENPSVLPNFSTLVMGVDGDSITAGNQWSKYVADILGVAAHQNVGVGSSYYACKQVVYNGVTYTTQEYDDPNFAGIAPGTIAIDSPEAAQKTANNVARCHIGKFIANVTAGTYSAPDIFCFAFGTNDSVPTDSQVNAAISGSALPSIAESMDMAGGMRYAVQKIMQTYPNCKIFILLPIQSANATRNANNLLKIEAIKKVAQAMSVPVIDMYSNCGIVGLLETGTGPYLSDGLHPNAAGQKLMGAFAAEQIIALYGRKIS